MPRETRTGRGKERATARPEPPSVMWLGKFVRSLPTVQNLTEFALGDALLELDPIFHGHRQVLVPSHFLTGNSGVCLIKISCVLKMNGLRSR